MVFEVSGFIGPVSCFNQFRFLLRCLKKSYNEDNAAFPSLLEKTRHVFFDYFLNLPRHLVSKGLILWVVVTPDYFHMSVLNSV